jgi:insulysin
MEDGPITLRQLKMQQEATVQQGPTTQSAEAVAGMSDCLEDTFEKVNGVTVVTEALEVSLLDNRAYRVIRLPNGLEALLVHDPDADVASASLDLGIGSFSDDPDMLGIAHAIEHVGTLCLSVLPSGACHPAISLIASKLLSRGSEKYPEENDFRQFIEFNSGIYNAYTRGTTTCYFFTVAENGDNSGETESADHVSPLRGALDRLAQFFISPLFLESVLDRELGIVDSEHSKNLQSDLWRLDQLKRELSNSGHPFHKFGTGTLDTLKVQPEMNNINPRDRIIGFFDKYYSANLMTLAVLGSETLDTLESWVAEMFSPVPNKALQSPRWQEVDPFGPEQLGKLCFVKPVKELMELDLTFPIADQWEFVESWPDYFISALVEHEGPGSILSYLKSEGWADFLSAGARSVCAGSPGLFTCVVYLTEEVCKAQFPPTSIICHENRLT